MVATADDLWPAVSRLSREERIRLARLALSSVALGPETPDSERYRAMPPQPDEFADGTEDPLAWDAEGWDEVS